MSFCTFGADAASSPGVEARVNKCRAGGVGMVRLAKAERIPRASGVFVKVKLEGELGGGGVVLVEPGTICGEEVGLQMEEMVVEPDVDGFVSVMVENHSGQALTLAAGQEIGCASQWEELPECQGEEVCVRMVTLEEGETMSEEAVMARRAALADRLQLGSERLTDDQIQELRSLILESDDVFAVE